MTQESIANESMSHLPIETRDLTKTFDSRTAVDRISLQVQPGDVFGFLGQNGAGKSTTIRMLLGLVKPSSGQVSLLGHDVPRYREQALRKVGAIVDAPAFYDNLTGLENLRIFSGLTGHVAPHKYREVLRWVNLSGRENDKVRVYSHGMRQRLGLAQALLPQPELLILDEPTRGIDVGAKAEVHHFINDLAAQGLGIILISSDLPEVLAMSDRILVMREGRQMGIFNRAEATQETILTAAMGQYREAGEVSA
jgi:ABC-2 type transport system ATP-binding protein